MASVNEALPIRTFAGDRPPANVAQKNKNPPTRIKISGAAIGLKKIRGMISL
jgi:hypothetical protein